MFRLSVFVLLCNSKFSDSNRLCYRHVSSAVIVCRLSSCLDGDMCGRYCGCYAGASFTCDLQW